MSVLPTKICENSDLPPEVEVRFDLKTRNVKKTDDEEIDMESVDLSDNEIENENKNENENENGNGNKNEKEDSDDLDYNWQLKFVHNQLFDNLSNANRFCPGKYVRTYVHVALLLKFFIIKCH